MSQPGLFDAPPAPLLTEQQATVLYGCAVWLHKLHQRASLEDSWDASRWPFWQNALVAANDVTFSVQHCLLPDWGCVLTVCESAAGFIEHTPQGHPIHALLPRQVILDIQAVAQKQRSA